MRDFNDFERAVITTLVNARRTNDIANLCAAKYILKATGCYAIEWETNVSYEKARFFCEDKDAPISVIFGGLDVLSLLKYLEDNGYLLVMQQSNISSDLCRLYSSKKYTYENGVYLKKMEDNSKAAILGCEQILNTDVALLLDRYAHSIIYPTTELELYVKRGFKTEDEARFEAQQKDTKQSIKVARWGVFVAFVVGLLGLLATYLSTKTPITLNQEQYNSIIENVKLNTIPETVDVKITNDTLNVNIKESIRINTRSHITNLPKP